MNTREPSCSRVAPGGCITLVGMAAAGKTTIGRLLAELLGWGHVDSDHVIESVYGARLQQITDSMSKEEFLDLEASVIVSLKLSRTVISTGGSVVYRQNAVDYLKELGPLLHLDVPLPIILERIARKPDRGLAIAPGQTIEDLYEERKALYHAAATRSFIGGDGPATTYASTLAEWLWTEK